MSPVKILIVEDERLVADDLRETLELLGYEVPAMATSGEEAIAKVASVMPDLVLMDIRLGGEMDGVEASELIQSCYQIPVVYLTANADRATLERVKASHPFGYILKPFNEKLLSATIEVALSRYEAEAEIQKALLDAETRQENAETQIQRKAEYLSLIAHELRNPLTAIKFAAEILQDQDDLPKDKRYRFIQRIQIASKSLNDLLEDVLTLERTSTKKLEFTPASIDLVNFCEEMIESLRFTSGEHYRFVFSTDQTHCPVFLDEKLLWHLLNNLLSNAVKYSPQGGTITLTLQCNEKTIGLSVSDQGIGIPLEARARLFEPFQRAGNVGQIPGTGLGLAIAKQCVDLQGGLIAIANTSEQGTTFSVTLPKNAEPVIERQGTGAKGK